RRELFEEAAGIGLFRSRKEESQRRLENTHKNLDRVRDILTEVQPRLRSLKRQSDRFEEYQTLTDNLREYLRNWYGYQWHQKQIDLKIDKQAYQDQEKLLDSLRVEYANAEANVEMARKNLLSHRGDLEDAHRILSQNHHLLEEINRELAIVDERKRAFLQQKSNLEVDMANLQEEVQGYRTLEDTLHKEMDQFRAEYSFTSEEVAQVETKLTTLLSKKSATEEELAEIHQHRIQLETKKVQRAARLTELNYRLDSLVQEQK
ncbi:MAG: hypothetical protein ACK2TV_01380, partial [Anaerolineales bacterium]